MVAPALSDFAAQSPLWAITTYFNPIGYRLRRENYRMFRKHFRAPLLAIELTYGNAPELGESDADIVIHCGDGDLLWQKERLMNHALRSLPPQCRYVAWVDCDVLFEGHWLPAAISELQRAPLVQLFSAVHHAPPGPVRPVPPGGVPESILSLPSTAAAMASGGSMEEFRSSNLSTAPGFAWAAQRALLEKHGWYDACLVGSGDLAMVCAAFGRFDLLPERLEMSERRREHYLRWAEPFFTDVRGRVSFLRQGLIHLWHGDIRDRQYRSRYAPIREHGFDPELDLAVGSQGAWRWARSNPGLQAFVRDYFMGRNEDGAQPAQ